MNSNYSVFYSSEALNDLEDIYRYLAFDLFIPDVAEEQVNRIKLKIRSLNFMPSRNPIIDWEPWKSQGMHKFLVDAFVVVYMVNCDNATVQVARIIYSGRDIATIASRAH